jgi:putative transposase
MAGMLRVEYPGAIYHITHRGNGRMKIFSDDHDRERFLLRLADSADTYNVRVYMFCLMANHVQRVCETPEGNVRRFMRLHSLSQSAAWQIGSPVSGTLRLKAG